MALVSMKIVKLAKLDQPQRLHAAAALAADDDVIVDGNAHVAAGFDEVADQADARNG